MLYSCLYPYGNSGRQMDNVRRVSRLQSYTPCLELTWRRYLPVIKNQASNDSRIMKQIQTFVKFVTHLASDGATGGLGGYVPPHLQTPGSVTASCSHIQLCRLAYSYTTNKILSHCDKYSLMHYVHMRKTLSHCQALNQNSFLSYTCSTITLRLQKPTSQYIPNVNLFLL